jgi:hypothetical protein
VHVTGAASCDMTQTSGAERVAFYADFIASVAEDRAPGCTTCVIAKIVVRTNGPSVARAPRRLADRAPVLIAGVRPRDRMPRNWRDDAHHTIASVARAGPALSRASTMSTPRLLWSHTRGARLVRALRVSGFDIVAARCHG